MGCGLRRSPGLAKRTLKGFPGLSPVPTWPRKSRPEDRPLIGPFDPKFARCLPAAENRHSDNEPNIRLTVARRRRLCTVFPSTKSAVKVEGWAPGGCDCRQRKAAGLGWTWKRLFVRKKRDARPARGGHFDRQRRLENLFENFALQHRG